MQIVKRIANICLILRKKKKMRKLKIIFCGCFLIAAMSFTACGNSESGTGATQQQGTSATQKQQETNATQGQQGTTAAQGQQNTSAVSEQKQKTSQYDNNKYASIADYVASDEVQKSIEILSGMEGLDIKIKADGNKMIYEYKYTTIEKQAGMEEALESVLEGQKNIFINAANELKNEVNVDNPVVTVTYLDKNNDLIYSQDFPAN